MSEQNQTIEQEARAMGWAPKEEFRGDEARWVDAETFVERGRTVLPIVKKQKEQLEGEVATLKAETARLQQLFTASQESIRALQDFHSENTKRQVKAAREAILMEIKQAKRDGDTDLEVDLLGELSKADAAVKAAEENPAPKPSEVPVVPGQPIDPAYNAWVGKNPWFGTDARKTNLAYSIASALRADSDNDGLVGKAFYDKIDEEMAVRASGGQHAKVGNSSSTSSGGGSSGKGYESLPAEAKKICDADAKRFVGDGRMFKTVAEYRKFYAEQVLGE